MFVNGSEPIRRSLPNSKVKIPNKETKMALGVNPCGDAFETTTNEEKWFKGNIYSVKVYNHALTDEEVAYNYAIDKARFNITE